MDELVAALGPGDAPEAWEPIAAAFARSAAQEDSQEWERAVERYQLDLLLAERPPGVLPDLAGAAELRNDAANRALVLGEYAGWYGWVLAQDLFLGGRLASAESVSGWLLEALAGSDGLAVAATRIHILRAELARKTGRWGAVDGELAAGETALTALARLVQDPQKAAYLPVYEEDLARLYALQAQVELELGRLDRVGELLREAECVAQESGLPSAPIAMLLVRVDQLLMQERFQEVLDTVRPLRLSGGPGVYLAAEGLASLELERERRTPEPGAAELLREFLDSDTLDVAGRFAAQVHLADALCIARAGSPDDANLDAGMREALAVARETARMTRGLDGRPLEDEGVLAVLEWRSRSEEEGAEAREHLLQAYDNLLEAWSASALRPGGLGFLQFQARRTRVISAVVDADLAASAGEAGKRAALERLFEVQAMGSIARELRLGPCTLDEVRAELLAPGEGCLVFLPAADASHLFTFDGQTLEHHPLPPVDDLQPLVKDARGLRGAAGEEAARTLRDALLPPAARAWIESHHALTLVGFGLLPGVQIEELPAWSGEAPASASKAPSPPLGAQFAIASLPSVPLGLSLARRARARGAPAGALVLAFNADPRGVAGLKPFTFGDAERRALSAPFLAERTRYLADASRQDLAGLTGERLAIVHVLCHGVWDRAEEVGAALVLASDQGAELVHADDLPALEVDLLILTACDAERGPLRLGDDLAATLGGRALAQGASCVLVADGRVEVDAALKMGEALTKELAGGASPAEALRRATAALPERAARARYRVLGLGHAPVGAGAAPPGRAPAAGR